MKMIKFIGKFGEYSVLAKLLENNIESYSAIKHNQTDWDITAIISRNHIVRIQVKTTYLENRSTNNNIKNIDKNYDFIVIVIIEPAIENAINPRYFILNKSEALSLMGPSQGLGVSRQIKKKFTIKSELASFEDRWDKISN